MHRIRFRIFRADLLYVPKNPHTFLQMHHCELAALALK